MNIQSLGYKTDLFFPRFDGEVVDRGDYTVIRTPSNPTFHWGNFLLFDRPPAAGDFERWQRLFAEEIGKPSDIGHVAFGWDTVNGEKGDLQSFLDAGLRPNSSVVLTASAVNPPPKVNADCVIRPLREDWEWESATEAQISCRAPEHTLEGYTPYKTRAMARYRRMVQAGLGEWFGAFLEGRAAADLGVFVENGVGRFQSVVTHPDFRRRGLCGTLVYEAARYAFERLGAETLVMVADEEYHAAKIYESVGFLPTEHHIGVDWWEGADGNGWSDG